MASRTRALVGGLAIFGAVVVAVQAWGYGSWLLTGDPAPISSPSPVPAEIRAAVRMAELTSVAGATVWLVYVVWAWRRAGNLTWPALWTIAWACTFWQEPLVNARNHTFSFNKAFHNLGDWTTHLPFVPASYSPLPEALVLEGLVFVYLLPLLAIAVAAYARVVRRLLPFRSVVPTVLVAYVSVVVFDLAFELQGIHQSLLRYVEVGGPVLNAGQPEQWPILEGLGISVAWAFPGILTFLLRDHWRVQDARPSWWTGSWRPTPVTILAAIGATNLVFGLYNATYIAVMDGTISHQPAWLAPIGG